MENQFTKGLWHSTYDNGSWKIQDQESYQDGLRSAIAEVYYFNDEADTSEANALLISKAPEMLEMLIALKDKLGIVYYEKEISEIENLIKSATTL